MWWISKVCAVVMLSVFVFPCSTIPSEQPKTGPLHIGSFDKRSESVTPRREQHTREPQRRATQKPARTKRSTPALSQPKSRNSTRNSQRKIRPLEVWKGIASLKNSRLATPYGAVENTRDWVKTWKALRPDQPVPHVDFARDMVLVGIMGNPNHLCNVRMFLQPDGNLIAQYSGTLMAFRTRNHVATGYMLTRIPRRGIRLVNGVCPKPIPHTPAGVAGPFPSPEDW